tara:strand:+ start:83 stop:529 length:447 start_codon:yes stop_codon:yes gene_type:complete
MAEETILERTYNVPLRKEFLKVPKYKRAKKAVTALKQFLVKHMKSDNVKIGKYLNDEIWKHGIKNPPHHVKLNAVKDKEGLVTAELVGAPVEAQEGEGKEEEKASQKKEEPKKEEQVSTKSEETKVEEKPAIEKKETKSPKKEPKKDK